MGDVTKHAKERSKERLGLPKKAVERLLPRIREKGIRSKDAKGRMAKYLNYLHDQHTGKRDIVIYGKFVYIFNWDTGNLITTFGLPNRLK